ncbi:MAG: TetR family transcriptional regulator, partial [Minwuiales bacterium]|nr:TetR family transcriptional regulator [Minwuiales bacterium]
MVQTFDLISSGGPKNGRLDARERLLDAAVGLFAERGFDGVSTRELVSRAKVNLSAITYHFGGKEALYRAVFE